MSTADGTVIGNTQIFGSAPRNRAFNVVLLAEGFTNAQQNDFNNACNAFVTAFRATPPYDDLSPAINIFRVNVASTDSGADDPTSTGGTGAVVLTYFDATFGANGIRRLLVCNATTALTVAAAQVPEFTVVLVVVNSTVYGGSGGSVGTYSLASGATEIALHEMGHTAYGLADEYAYYAGRNETGHDHHPAVEPTQPNVTINTNRATLKWGWAVAATTALPTMSNPNCSQVDGRPSPVPAGTVGLFEGADYYHCGAYRPEYSCKMQALGIPFCRVCRQAIWNRIGPLTTLQARVRTPITVVARYPEHLDVFGVASNGRTMSNWWDIATGWAGWFQVSGGSRTRAAQALRLLRLPVTQGISTCSQLVLMGGSTAYGGMLPQVGAPGSRSELLCAGPALRSMRWLAIRTISTCSRPLQTARSCRRGGMRERDGRTGSRCQAAWLRQALR